MTNSYSTGSLTGNNCVCGLVGDNNAIVNNSLWYRETSGTEESDGWAGKTTAKMQDIATLPEVAWDIIAVAPSENNPTYVWNIVDYETYSFLSWQS